MNRAELFFSLLLTANIAMAHPLDGAIRHLSQSETELATVKNQNADDADVVQAVDQLSQTVGTAWTNAMLIPIRSTDAKLSQLGFDVQEYNTVNHYYHAHPNQNLPLAQQDAQALIPDRWQKMLKIAYDQSISIGQITSMLDVPDYTNNIAKTNRDAVEAGANGTRMDALDMIRRRATTTIACIQYFKTALVADGLVPMAGVGGSFTWSADDLQRVHGAHDIAQLSSDQKMAVKTELQELVSKFLEFDGDCLSISEGAFIQAELNKLAGS